MKMTAVVRTRVFVYIGGRLRHIGVLTFAELPSAILMVAGVCDVAMTVQI